MFMARAAASWCGFTLNSNTGEVTEVKSLKRKCDGKGRSCSTLMVSEGEGEMEVGQLAAWRTYVWHYGYLYLVWRSWKCLSYALTSVTALRRTQPTHGIATSLTWPTMGMTRPTLRRLARNSASYVAYVLNLRYRLGLRDNAISTVQRGEYETCAVSEWTFGCSARDDRPGSVFGTRELALMPHCDGAGPGNSFPGTLGPPKVSPSSLLMGRFG